MCLFEIVDMLLLSKNIVLERDEIFERDAVFEQNKKLSLLSLTPTQASVVFQLPASVVFKDNRDNRDNSWRKKCAYLKSLNVMLFLSKIKNCLYCLYCL